MHRPTDRELQLLRLIASERGRMTHDDPRLGPFCDDNAGPADVFNACKAKGWTRNTHDYLSGDSTVYLTDAGKARVWDAEQNATCARSAALEEAARVADYGMLVPPDGGSPTQDEIDVAERIASAIRRLKDDGHDKRR